MSIADVLAAHGAKRLRWFLALVALFLLLRAVRRPVAALVGWIEAGLSRLDSAAIAGVSTPDSEFGSRRGGQQSRQERTPAPGSPAPTSTQEQEVPHGRPPYPGW